MTTIDIPAARNIRASLFANPSAAKRGRRRLSGRGSHRAIEGQTSSNHIARYSHARGRNGIRDISSLGKAHDRITTRRNSALVAAIRTSHARPRGTEAFRNDSKRVPGREGVRRAAPPAGSSPNVGEAIASGAPEGEAPTAPPMREEASAPTAESKAAPPAATR